jgi:hypothetical protein
MRGGFVDETAVDAVAAMISSAPAGHFARATVL